MADAAAQLHKRYEPRGDARPRGRAQGYDVGKEQHPLLSRQAAAAALVTKLVKARIAENEKGASK